MNPHDYEQKITTLTAERDEALSRVQLLEIAFYAQTKELELALSFLSEDQLSEYRKRQYPTLYT